MKPPPYPEKLYSREDFSDDFTGAAGKISALIFDKRPIPCKQTIASALREFFYGDPPGLPEVLYDKVASEEMWVETDDASIRNLLFSPKDMRAKDLPLLLFMHGGGWVLARPEDAEYTCRSLALSGQCGVLCIDYRLAPEFPYPHALNDCIAVYRWARRHFNRVAVGGEASGATLALALTLKMRDAALPLPDAALIICGVTDLVFEHYPSFLRYAPNGLLFDYAFSTYARAVYAPYELWKDPYVSPAYGTLTGFCPTFFLQAGKDPFFDDNRAFIAKLRESGNVVHEQIHADMPHGYYLFPGLTHEEKEAYAKMGAFLIEYLRKQEPVG
jgi:acetyl esterase